MRFEVPQFIEIEDKIFGPLTWRQFLYLAGGIGIAVVIFLTTNIWVFVLVGLPVALLALALSFYPVNNRPFSYFLESMINYFTRQRRYFWRRKEGVVYRGHTSNPEPQQDLKKKTGTGGGINALTRKLEIEMLQNTDQ